MASPSVPIRSNISNVTQNQHIDSTEKHGKKTEKSTLTTVCLYGKRSKSLLANIAKVVKKLNKTSNDILQKFGVNEKTGKAIGESTGKGLRNILKTFGSALIKVCSSICSVIAPRDNYYQGNINKNEQSHHTSINSILNYGVQV